MKTAIDRLVGITSPRITGVVNPIPHAPVLLRNRVQIEVVGPDEDGKIVVKQRIDHYGNIMASYGLNRLTEMLASDAGGASVFARTMAIGTDNSAESSGDDSLGASTQLCGTFDRSDQGERTVRFLGTFASDGNACQVHEIGIFYTNQATASMIARSALGTDSINRGASDEIRASYDIIAGAA